MGKAAGEVDEKASWAGLEKLGLHPKGHREPWKQVSDRTRRGLLKTKLLWLRGPSKGPGYRGGGGAGRHEGTRQEAALGFSKETGEYIY